MNPFLSFILVSVFAFGSGSEGKTILDLLKLCSLNDPNLNGCVKDAANTLLPHIANGIPDFEIPALDPLYTPMFELIEETEYASIDLKYTELTQIGLSKMIVDDASIDQENGVWTFKMSQPVYTLVGHYKSKGTVLDVTINGEGKFNSTHFDTKVDLTMTVSREKRDGTEYFKLDKFSINYTFGTAMMEYEGLIGDDPNLAASTNKFLNEHSHEILTDLKPALEQAFGDLFRGYLEKLVQHAPVDKLFPAN
ncbi:UNVERIFIED_CONTAM: hypothetical protein PYX00_010700 [Menopon gallinae]|uniref:Uncharacterized protein n=1 Tax=Menopon gallinae TaxID=328185 RepID=A0AAW2HHE2_9NEOP